MRLPLMCLVLAACQTPHDGAREVASGDDVAQVEVAVDARCESGVVTCVRGVRATCEGDGWRYEACGPGEICAGDGCVDNVATLVIAVDTVRPDAMSDALPEALIEEVAADCEGRELEGMLVASSKRWVQRLARRFAEPNFEVVLLGPPADDEGGPLPQCSPANDEQARSCGGKRLVDWARFLSAQEALRGDDLRALVPDWASADAGVEAAAGRLVGWSLAAEDAASALRWSDGDRTNDELNLSASDGYAMGLIAYLYLASRESTPCSVYDVVHVGPFAAEQPMWTPDACVGAGGDVDYNVWSQWLRWGVRCDAKYTPCRAGSACIEACTDDSPHEPCPYSVCVPDAFSARDGWRDSQLYNLVLGDYGDLPPFARDRWGHDLVANTHAIAVGTSGYGPLEPTEQATRAAVLGDGVAVTPCPEWLEAHLAESNFGEALSCDYLTQYARLEAAIAEHRAAALCTPTMVGLPTRSADLIR